MATDGDIDFTGYTREQLDNAVARMDHQRYPINSRKLIEEYQLRKVAEKKAADLATEAKTVVAPDRMLSASKAFDVTYEPESSIANWLAPSRNDFHLIGSGTLRVDDVLVCVQGRRYAYLIGIPVVDTDELGRQYVVNVEVQGRAVRFELRVPGEKIRGISLWLRSQAEADELAKMLPLDRTSDFTPQLERHVEFERSLIAQSPKTPVTYALLGLCVFVYVGTALGTNHLSGFDGRSLLGLGSNYGPYTTAGDWWRLLTSMFLHAGLFHLAFNMWALVSFGRVVERLFGGVSYALIYMVAGVAGGLASLTWNPAVNSVGASGAIFGLLGALIAAQVRNDGTIPTSILRPLRNSSLLFTAYALAAGLLSSEVDNAAHLGGVATGFALGLLLSRPVTGLRLKSGAFVRRVGPAGVTSILILSVGVSAAKAYSSRLTGDSLYAGTVHWFGPGELNALASWSTLRALLKDGKLDKMSFARRLKEEVIPFWQEADIRTAKIDLPPNSVNYDSLQFLRAVTHERLSAYELLVKGLRQDGGDKVVEAALARMNLIQARIEQRQSAMVSAKK